MNLPNDVSRCHGLNCRDRDTCLRYTLRGTGGERTPQNERMRGNDVDPCLSKRDSSPTQGANER
jgi:hypothetical protein